MKIFITAKNTFTGADLKIGSYYNVEDATEGTLAQNSTFHALLELYWLSGLYSYPAETKEDFKKYVKKSLGVGYESYEFIVMTETGIKRGKAKKKTDIPENLALDENGDKLVWGILRSWSSYTKAQRMAMIQSLITEMLNLGIHTVEGWVGKKFNEILSQLELNSMKIAG